MSEDARALIEDNELWNHARFYFRADKLALLTEETTKPLTRARSTLKSGETHLAALTKDAQTPLKQATALLKNGEAKLDEVAKVIKTTGKAASGDLRDFAERSVCSHPA